MTVKELIINLQKCDPNAEVLMYDSIEEADSIIEGVYQEKHQLGWNNAPYYVKDFDYYSGVQSENVVILHNGGVSKEHRVI